jgi:hypothetical protein
MNLQQNAQQQADKKVSATLHRKAAELAGFTTVGEDLVVFDANIADTDEQNKTLDVSTKGYTDTKNTAKNHVVSVALRPVSTRLVALAFRSNNQVLKNEINYTENALLKMSDKRLVNVLLKYLNNARKYQPEMSSVGLTEAMIVTLEEATDDYKAKLLGTPQYQGEQKAANNRIAKNLAANKELKKNSFDKIMEIIRDEKPDIHAEYQNARKIKLTPSRTLALKVKAYEPGTLTPVAGVIITVIPYTEGDMLKTTGAELSKNVKRTSALGGCQVRNLADGKYLVTAEKAGRVTQSLIAYINGGEMTLVKFEMALLPD